MILRKYYIGILAVLTVLMNSCEDKKLQTLTANVPIYLTYEELRTAVEIEDPVEIVKPGKIYFKDDYIFINEFMEGVHVVDISDPSSPEQKAYIPVPGNVDMAIKGNMLYLDSYTDLVLIDVTDPANPLESARVEDILEYTLPPWDEDYPLADIDEDEGVVIDWEVKEYTREINRNPYPWPVYYGWESSARFDMASSSAAGVSAPASTYGVGGSMARFLTYDNYLYMLNTDYQLKAFDISDLENPELKYDKYVGWGLETMFIYDEHMYLGAQNGMYILSLEKPSEPFKKSMYSHITSCDPVVVQGDYAYVTMRSGNLCGGSADLLEVVDISNKYEPERIASYVMEEPYGLGISGNKLFVCQGENGLYVYDAANPQAITNNQLARFSDIHAFDVIPLNGNLYTTGDSGFYIYDYNDPLDIFKLGEIKVAE